MPSSLLPKLYAWWGNWSWGYGLKNHGKRAYGQAGFRGHWRTINYLIARCISEYSCFFWSRNVWDPKILNDLHMVHNRSLRSCHVSMALLVKADVTDYHKAGLIINPFSFANQMKEEICNSMCYQSDNEYHSACFKVSFSLRLLLYFTIVSIPSVEQYSTNKIYEYFWWCTR